MIKAIFQRPTNAQPTRVRARSLVQIGLVALTLAAVYSVIAVSLEFQNAPLDAPLVVNSTPGQLALWMAEQSSEEAPESILGQYARSWANQAGENSLDAAVLLNSARNGLVVFLWLVAGAGLVGAFGLIMMSPWSRPTLLVMLVGLDVLLFVVPVLQIDATLPTVMRTILLLLLVLLFSQGRVTKVLGFVVVLSALLVVWEALKAFSSSVDYRIALGQPAWTYQTYPTLDDALSAVESGVIRAIIVDSKELRELVREAPDEADASVFPHPDLRILTNLETNTSTLGLPIIPAFPGRLAVAVRAEAAGSVTSVAELVDQPVGTVAGDFADVKFLALPRQLVLLDLSIFNDLNLPHLQNISEALLQPARRNGPMLLLRILWQSGLFTWTEALVGFVSGALLGFLLGALFAHSGLMQRGLLPYVVASQTVPILAIAPMVVIWLGANWMSVAVISAFLTFFPVTINTMRGLQSPHPNAIELMRSYAASRWTIMWKLRFPSALPYIFTALKVSATASVVGAIIGELPSGIRDGLGGAILNFNQYYVSDPSKLWAAILVSAFVGIAFYIIIGGVERVIMPGKIQNVA